MTNEEFSIATLKSLWKDGATGFLVTSPTTFPTYEEAKELLDKYPHKRHMVIVRRTPGADWEEAWRATPVERHSMDTRSRLRGSMTKKREYAVGMRNGIYMCGHDAFTRSPQIFETREEAEELLATLPSHPSNPKVIITRPPVKKGSGCGCWEEA